MTNKVRADRRRAAPARQAPLRARRSSFACRQTVAQSRASSSGPSRLSYRRASHVARAGAEPLTEQAGKMRGIVESQGIAGRADTPPCLHGVREDLVRPFQPLADEPCLGRLTRRCEKPIQRATRQAELARNARHVESGIVQVAGDPGFYTMQLVVAVGSPRPVGRTSHGMGQH